MIYEIMQREFSCFANIAIACNKRGSIKNLFFCQMIDIKNICTTKIRSRLNMSQYQIITIKISLITCMAKHTRDVILQIRIIFSCHASHQCWGHSYSTQINFLSSFTPPSFLIDIEVCIVAQIFGKPSFPYFLSTQIINVPLEGLMLERALDVFSLFFSPWGYPHMTSNFWVSGQICLPKI